MDVTEAKTFVAHEVSEDIVDDLREAGDVGEFIDLLDPVEKPIQIFADGKTGALYCECHIRAEKLVGNATPDTPLDPDASADYRANRDLVEDHAAYNQMLLDAQQGRTFSNIVCEFISGDKKPLKVVGGQHRFGAIEAAYTEGAVDGIHGVKVYFSLDTEQRLDVQVISNTNIEVSRDLLDRMFETVSGHELRTWSQRNGLLGKKEDFADKRKRGGSISVRQARAFIINYFLGQEKKDEIFDQTETTPQVPRTGVRIVPEWERIKKQYPNLWDDLGLAKAGKEFQALVDQQRQAFVKTGTSKASNPDFAEKAMNDAILSAWAFVAGLLSNNEVRLQRHFDLKHKGKPDPLRAALLVVTSRVIIDALPEELRLLALPVLEGVDGRPALQY